LDSDRTLLDGLIHSTADDVAEAGAEWLDVELLALECDVIGGMVVKSVNMRRVLKTIQRLGPYKASVLIHGESGTGKELVARALHTLGPVPKGPFVTFNCSNLVESLAESQLFGHIRGAFTDAREDSLGYFRSANGGTLFLDEIGELPLRLQPKLLRAVETHEVQPVGSAHSYKVDIRLIAATNRDLRAMVKAGEFRDDLYYRLNATAILVPPLRERRDAIEALAVHRALQPALRQTDPLPVAPCDRRPASLRLARQRPRIRPRHPIRRHAHRRRQRRCADLSRSSGAILKPRDTYFGRSRPGPQRGSPID
jgi:transcriptional regulator with GAF, ATPase, and Fis domain